MAGTEDGTAWPIQVRGNFAFPVGQGTNPPCALNLLLVSGFLKWVAQKPLVFEQDSDAHTVVDRVDRFRSVPRPLVSSGDASILLE